MPFVVGLNHETAPLEIREKLARFQEPPPAMAFEISEAGIASARIGARTELDFHPLKPGSLAVSPIKENVIDPDEFMMTVRAVSATQAARKRRDVAKALRLRTS